jgi:hypothetical protein
MGVRVCVGACPHSRDGTPNTTELVAADRRQNFTVEFLVQAWQPWRTS